MHISTIKRIKNYRNLSGLEVSFHDEINFIVGENNLGKTNIIEMLNSLISTGKFQESDFTDIKEPIEIVFRINYDSDEMGFFENNFDIDDEYQITIRAIQEDVDARIEYFHDASGSPINSRRIKALNYIYYSSLRNPSKEMNFNRSQGTGRVLNYLMKKCLEMLDLDDLDLVQTEQIQAVVCVINERLKKINGIAGENIEAFLNNDKENIINRLLELGDSCGRPLRKLGDGVQYSFNLFLNILELIVHLKTSKKEDDFNDLLIEDEDGDKFLPILLALDEIEIHQHPYRQRTIIKEIQKIMKNENEDFTAILKELFGIDGIYGQIISVTHSPNILLDDYHHIIRLYFNGSGELATSSGIVLSFEPDVEKHLKNSFIYFKEAMFSKKVLLVEGITEYGALPIFAKRLGYGLDENGVGIIKLDGADAVIKIMDLFKAFGIDSLALLDKDKENYDGTPGIYFTDEIDFEEEVLKLFSFEHYNKYLIACANHDSLIGTLKKHDPEFVIDDYLENPSEYSMNPDIERTVMRDIRHAQIAHLKNRKNAINSALVSQFVDTVPESFEKLIKIAIAGEENDE